MGSSLTSVTALYPSARALILTKYWFNQGRPYITERHAGISPIFFCFLVCVDLESLYVYLANCMHDLASNTELDSENHKMKVMLTPKI